jgi:hypothetical protein
VVEHLPSKCEALSSIPSTKKKKNKKDIKIVNIYAPNVSAPNFIKQTLLDIKAQIDPNTMVVGDFNIPLLARHWWLTPVILDTQEAEIRRISV